MKKILNGLKTYRKFIRIGPLFVLNLMFILSSLLGGLFRSISPLYFILAIVSISLAWNFGTIINDYYDVEIDKINYPDRPMVQEALNPTQLKIVALIHAGISIVLASLVNIFSLIYILCIIIILFLYSLPAIRIKKTVFATSVIGFICGMAILIGGSVSSYSAENLCMALWVSVGISLLGSIKDFKDIEGDRAGGMKTLPVLFGIKKATYIIMGFTVVSVVLGIILLQFLLQKTILASILVIILGVITIILLQLHLNEKIEARKAHNITFILLSICLLAFFL